MPTYSYTHLTQDEHRCVYPDFDVTQSIKEEALTDCPTCGMPVKRIITTAPGYKFNGSGFTPKFHG